MGIVGVIAAFIGVYYGGKKSGETAGKIAVEKERADNAINSAENAIRQTDKVTEVKADVENKVASATDDDVVNKLRDKWSRD